MSGSQPVMDPWTEVRTRHGFQADELISALQKEIRRGQVENAGALAYEMATTSPELEHMLWQRLKVISVEDVGLGNPMAPILVDTLERFSQGFERGSGDRRLFVIHAVRYLSTSMKDRSSDEMSQWLARAIESGNLLPTVPDYALDMHTQRGSQMGRSRRHFFEEAAKIEPELPNRDTTYHQRLLEGLDERGAQEE
jgi:replication-associated recombination protein RarA